MRPPDVVRGGLEADFYQSPENPAPTLLLRSEAGTILLSGARPITVVTAPFEDRL